MKKWRKILHKTKKWYRECRLIPYTIRHISNIDIDFINEQYKYMFENEAMVSKTDTTGVITFANDKFLETTGYTAEEVIGKTHAIIKSPNTQSSIFGGLWGTIKSGKPWYGFIEGLTKDKQPFYSKVTIYPIIDSHNKIVEYLAFRTDITEIIGMKKDIEITQKEIILAMGSIGENRSGETGNHVKRVAEYSYLLATEYGITPVQAEIIRMAAPMHDIGKVAIPDSILNKPGKLTDEEFEVMKDHSRLGHIMFKDSKLELCKIASDIAYEHHEKWDGSGYPRGIKGEDITIHGRIVAVADVFDALRSERCYKKAWSYDEIIEYFDKESGKSFDPFLIDIFKESLDKIKLIETELVDK